jgi:hypothetical protein
MKMKNLLLLKEEVGVLVLVDNNMFFWFFLVSFFCYLIFNFKIISNIFEEIDFLVEIY